MCVKDKRRGLNGRNRIYDSDKIGICDVCGAAGRKAYGKGKAQAPTLTSTALAFYPFP